MHGHQIKNDARETSEMPKPSNTDIRPPITPPETFFNLKSGWDDGLTGPLDPVLDPFGYPFNALGTWAAYSLGDEFGVHLGTL